MQHNDNFSTLLIQAIENKKLEDVNNLISSGAGVNHQDETGKISLHHAIEAGFVEGVKLLLDRGADASIPNKYGAYPIKNNQFNPPDIRKQIEDEFHSRGLLTPAYASHRTLITLINKLSYRFSDRGICHGIAVQAMVDFHDGVKGVERFNKRSEVIEKYSTESSTPSSSGKNVDVLKQKIDEVKDYREQLYKAYRFKINGQDLTIESVIQQQTLNKDKTILDSRNLTEDEWNKIISHVINSEFPGISQTDQEELIHYFYQLQNRRASYPNIEFKEKIGPKKPSILDKRDIKTLQQQIHLQTTLFIINKKINEHIDKGIQTQFGEEGFILIEIETMMQNCAIGHRIGEHAGLLEEKERSLAKSIFTHMLSAFPIIQSPSMEKKGIIRGASITHLPDKESLEKILDLLKKGFDSQSMKDEVIFGMGNWLHSITIAYFGNDQWGFCDSNHPPARVIHDTKYLADLIQSVLILTTDNNENMPINAEIFTSIRDAEKLTICMNELKQNTDWKNLCEPKKYFSEIEYLAARHSDVETMQAAQAKQETSFMERYFGKSWKIVLGNGLFFGAFIGAAATVPIHITFSGLLLIAGAGAIGLGAIFMSLAATVRSILFAFQDTRVQERLELEKIVNEKQISPPHHTHRFIDAVIGSKTRSRTGFRETVTNLNRDIRNQLEYFFSYADKSLTHSIFFSTKVNAGSPLLQKNTPEFPPYIKKIYDELQEKLLKTEENYTPEEKLSRAISHAMDAFYYESFFSFRNHQTNAIYEKFIDLIDVNKTCEKIIERIKDLDGKVYGIEAGAGTAINIQGKTFVVSEKTAEIYHCVQVILEEQDEEKQLQFLGHVLHVAEQEFTSSKIWHPLRHDDVSNFFGQIKQLLVVGNKVDKGFNLEKLLPQVKHDFSDRADKQTEFLAPFSTSITKTY